MEAARELFATEGLGPSLNDVAHHAGVGVGTVYRRFPTKDALFEAIFIDGLDQLTQLAESALQQQDSWQGFAWFVEQMCEITATNRGLREIAFSKAYGGDRIDAVHRHLEPALAKLIVRAQSDGHLRPEVSPTDMPLIGLMTGTVSEFAGHVGADLWRRYVAILLDGMRHRADHGTVSVDALSDEALELAMHTWEPAGPPR